MITAGVSECKCNMFPVPWVKKWHSEHKDIMFTPLICRKEKVRCASWTWSGRLLPETESVSRTWCCWTLTTARQPFWTTWRNVSLRTWYTWVWVDLRTEQSRADFSFHLALSLYWWWAGESRMGLISAVFLFWKFILIPWFMVSFYLSFWRLILEPYWSQSTRTKS